MCNRASARLAAMRRGSDSVQTAGSPERAARSRRPRRSCRTSDVLPSVSDIAWPQWPGSPASGRRRSALRSRPVAGAEFAQELVGWYEEWVLVEKPADDDQRMGAEDIHHDAGAELREVVCADDQVVVLWQDAIHPGLKLQEGLHPRALQRPLHVGPKPSQPEAIALPAGQHL